VRTGAAGIKRDELAPDVFEEVQLVEAVAVLEQNHRQKIKENGAGL
jgi:predicted protein tyrosine phosphatase